MSKEILEKAIKKAIDGGWKPFAYMGLSQTVKTVEDAKFYFDDNHGDYAVNNIIWRHDFAKALWGEELIQYPEEDPHTVTARMGRTYARTDELWVWQYHLQQIVIADDPIKYLGENI